MPLLWTVVCILLAASALCDQNPAFGGLTCAVLTDAQLDTVEQVYGEPAGMMVAAVAEASLAAATGVRPGDILISVRMPEETDYYPMSGDMEEWTDFCGKYQASDAVRLLLLRNEAGRWSQVKCQLGKPIGEAVDDGIIGGDGTQLQNYVAGSGQWSFASADPQAVLATAPDGTPLKQADLDVFGAVLAWSFNVRLTEAQKEIVRATLVEYWQNAPANEILEFNNIRRAPEQIATLTPEQKVMVQLTFANNFIQIAQQNQGHPFALLVMQISGNARSVLAGAGTAAELTQQDVDAVLEMYLFQLQMMTGQAVFLTPEEHVQFTQQIVEKYNAASDQEKLEMANADAQWAVLRAAFAQAQAAQQQQLMQQQAQQWQQQYSQTYPNDPYMQGYLGGQAQWDAMARANPRGTRSNNNQATLGIMQNMIDMQHRTSMGIINNIGSGPTTNVYDSAGNWMYDY